MPEQKEFDFERYWLAKFAGCIDAVAGPEVRRQVMDGSEDLSDASSRRAVIGWSQAAMDRLEALVDEGRRREIMAGCGCQYPKADLQEVRAAYEATGDLDAAHATLQQRFETFLGETLRLDPPVADEVVRRGMGLAGIRAGDRIIATKIPKSGYLVEYLEETDLEKRRRIYCHCPRVRDALRLGMTLPATYCYCGAGYYRGIWEEILQRPVEVEVVESVLDGGDACRIAIHLPPEVL
jgi:hypothetical protein